MEQTMQQIRQVITTTELLRHWQGHRDLTRKVIDAFPEQELFNFSIGGMRPFAAMVMEFLGIAVPSLKEMVYRKTGELDERLDPNLTKADLLQLWDKATEEIDELFTQIPVEQYHETINLFGKYEGTIWSSIFYFIDNEIHHRGQGYVYLRALGITPPEFWNRP